ncbi:MAG: alpha/beta hydrolase [Gemmatimonas sp.]
MSVAAPTLSGPSFGPAAGGKPTALIVLLHGLGTDGHDLIPLAPVLARSLPRALFLAPSAPFPCEMPPLGRQWFSLADRSPSLLVNGIAMAAPILNGFLDAQLAALGLPPGALALVGFSQGAMMALHAGLRRRIPPACILAFSGALIDEVPPPGPDGYPPVLLVHGEDDEVVPWSSFRHARAALSAAGVPVEALARPGLAHGIDQGGLDAAQAMLARSLGAVAGPV